MAKRKQTPDTTTPPEAPKQARIMPHFVSPVATYENHVKPFLSLFNAIFPALQDVPALRTVLADNYLTDRELDDALPNVYKQFEEIFADIQNRDATGEECAVNWTHEQAMDLRDAGVALIYLLKAFPVSIRTPAAGQLEATI